MVGMKVDTERNDNETDRIAAEAVIIRRIRQGDGEAFRALVERYQGRVHGLALRIIRDVHEAEDLTQETFVRAYRALDRFDTRYPFVNWLLRIATNVSRSALKRRRPIHSLTEAHLAGLGTEAGASSEEERENLAVVRTALDRALGALSETKRAALLLFHQSRRSYADIAEILDMPIGTVKTAIHRARTEIRQALASRGLMG